MSLKAIMAVLVFGAATVSLSSSAQDQAYPSRPIHIVVPAPAGGPTDVLARIVGRRLGDAWKQSVIVENKPGANQIIGTEFVARAAPDGYTLLMAVDSTMTMHPHAYKKLPYNPIKDFVPVTTVADVVVAIMSNSSSPFKTLPEALTLVKGAPGKYSYASGTLTTQVIMERLSMLSGSKLLYVPYKGSAPAVAALIAGDVNFSVDGYTAYKGFHQQGKVSVLATTGVKRAAATPNVPTLGELGYPGFETGVWIGVMAPTGTPAPIVAKLAKQINDILSMREVKEQFDTMGLEPLPSTPERMRDFIQSESDKWAQVIRTAGITLE